MKIEALPGQEIGPRDVPGQEQTQLARIFERHDQLTAADPGFVADALSPYSFGLFAAGAISGSFSRYTAFKLAGERARIVRAAEAIRPSEQRTGMAVILGDGDFARSIAERLGLHWTNDNGYAHVLGGALERLSELAGQVGQRFRGYLTAEGIYHADVRKPESLEFRDYLEDVEMEKPKIPLISSTNPPKFLETADALREELWESMNNRVVLRKLVEFWKENGYDTILDISLEGTICKMVNRFQSGLIIQTLEDYLASLRLPSGLAQP